MSRHFYETDKAVNCFCMNTLEFTVLYNVGVTESCATVLEGMNGFGVLGSERNCVNP